MIFRRVLNWIIAVSALVLILDFVYLYIFGRLLGYHVSSFDEPGPYWPMELAFFSGGLLVLSLLVKAAVLIHNAMKK
ncbi:MAG: hypothetical protein B5766_07445 [Candidatus Lumbricidophila eiseniae]|uniref:Uncharacterized protein n=1 Tax=Candidatus Lumbricidiphila eiseniae TaxID=1969409 RepID=A0A2A6FQJ0_9MICO|nr:MAG: hypothetical protein B5766_07445 [Candidatus Lumbricidophila eiseniae]